MRARKSEAVTEERGLLEIDRYPHIPQKYAEPKTSEEQFRKLMEYTYGPKMGLNPWKQPKTEVLGKQVEEGKETPADRPDKVRAFMADCVLRLSARGLSIEEAKEKCQKFLEEQTEASDRTEALEEADRQASSEKKLVKAEERFKELLEKRHWVAQTKEGSPKEAAEN